MACVAPQELVGYGSLLQYLNPLTSTWTTVGGTKDLSFPSRSRGSMDTTEGSGDRWRTKRPGILREQAAVSYEMKFLKAQWSVLNSMMNNDIIYEWRVVLMADPEQFYYKFCGFITDLGDEIPMEELIMSTVEITPTGKPSWGNLN